MQLPAGLGLAHVTARSGRFGGRLSDGTLASATDDTGWSGRYVRRARAVGSHEVGRAVTAVAPGD